MPQFLRSELPVRAVTRQHWVVLFRRVHRYTLLTLVALAVAARIWPWPMALVLVLVLGGLLLYRWLLWRNERIYLTGKRIVRMDGIPAITRHEAWLRVDRISGAQFAESWFGGMLGYATIDLEAPGDHPGVRHLIKVARASPFYLLMRDLVFGEASRPDPDDDPDEYDTARLPVIDPRGPRNPGPGGYGPDAGWPPGDDPGRRRGR